MTRRRPPPAAPIVQYENLLFFWSSGKGFDGEAGVDWEGPEDADCDELGAPLVGMWKTMTPLKIVVACHEM